MVRLLIFGILIHLVFIASIFDIYFTSPLIHGMEPQKSKRDPPAKRLVLFVADGLRAESLYGDNLDNLQKMFDLAPYLSSLITTKKAAWGISNTRVPTETRPGHVAIIAGIYEDPSAVAKGWKENPVDFDSVFNRSRNTWAWGSLEVTSMFAKFNRFHKFGDSEQDFSGKKSTTLLDTWVFDKVSEFLNHIKVRQDYPDVYDNGNIFFLHLLGLDTAGHTYKPNSKEVDLNIKVVDDGVRRMVDLFNNFYNDDKTVFVFTSDHGMTNWGSHGAGSKDETETPFILWGAGIKPDFKPLNIEQADFTPLMATLIGSQIPVNSVGVLPTEVLNLSEEDKVHAFFVNAKQIYLQFAEKQKRTEKNSISFLYSPYPDYSKEEFRELFNSIKSNLTNRKFSDAMINCKTLIKMSLKGLDYYHNYYQKLLLTCISLTYIGWIFLLVIDLTDLSEDRCKILNSADLKKFIIQCKKRKYFCIIHTIFLLGSLLTTLLLLVQSLPFSYFIYCLVPQYIWWIIFWKAEKWWPSLKKLFSNSKKSFNILVTLVLCLIGIEAIAMSFFERPTLTVALAVISIWPYTLKKISMFTKVLWTFTCCINALFLFIHIMEVPYSYPMISLAATLWIFIRFYLVLKLRNSKERQFFTERQLFMAFIENACILAAIVNMYFVDMSLAAKRGLPLNLKLITWFLSVLAFIFPCFGSTFVLERLIDVMMSFLIPFILLSYSFEPFFMLVLFALLIQWLYIENVEFSFDYKPLSIISFKSVQNSMIPFSERTVKLQDFRRGFFVLFFLIFAFFGMGNIASLNSFDPMWVRNYVTSFSPFLMTSLILFKFLIPHVIVTCVFRGVTTCLEAPIDKLFFVILIFCDIMGLQFLYFVTNTGSWLDIGSSISHYVIVQAMVLFLIVFYILAVCLTQTSMFTPFAKKSFNTCKYHTN